MDTDWISNNNSLIRDFGYGGFCSRKTLWLDLFPLPHPDFLQQTFTLEITGKNSNQFIQEFFRHFRIN